MSDLSSGDFDASQEYYSSHKKKKEFFSYLPKQIVDQLGSSISSTTHNAQILCKDETTDVKIQNTFHTLTKMIDIL